MKVVILAGGEGKRLKEVLNGQPKPMAKVAGRPFLEYLLLYLKKYNLKDIILSVGYKKDLIKDYFGDGRRFGVTIDYVEENDFLGTGGAIKFAADGRDLGEHFLVVNGDSFFNLDYHAFLNFHLSSPGIITMALTRIKNPTRSGVVELSSNSTVLKFNEKIAAEGPSLINVGIYAFSRKIIDHFPEQEKFSLENDVFPNLLNAKILGFPADGYFIDIGIPEDFLRAQEDFSKIVTV